MKKIVLTAILPGLLLASQIEIQVVRSEVIYDTTQPECKPKQTNGFINLLGSISGAIIGGVIGYQFGSGHGQSISTGVGTMIGSAAGDNAARKMQNIGECNPEKGVVIGYKNIGYYNNKEYYQLCKEPVSKFIIDVDE